MRLLVVLVLGLVLAGFVYGQSERHGCSVCGMSTENWILCLTRL